MANLGIYDWRRVNIYEGVWWWWKEQVTPSRPWNDAAIISVLGPAECWFLLSQNNSLAYLANPSPFVPYLTYVHAYAYIGILVYTYILYNTLSSYTNILSPTQQYKTRISVSFTFPNIK